MEDELKLIYYDPETGFSGVDKLYRVAKEKGLQVTKTFVKEWIKKQTVHEIFERKPYKNKYNSFIAPYPRYEYQLDIIYMKRGEENNDYVLCCVDILTKIGDCELLGNDKSAPEC